MTEWSRRITVFEPIGEIHRFELPYRAVPDPLVNPALGFHSLAVRAGERAPYEVDATVVDAADHRLVRAGVWLAHRVIGGQGEWYLAADRWFPWLPREHAEPARAAEELPPRLAGLIAPFARGATVAPVARLTCRREEFALRGEHAQLIAVVRDEKVQVRSAELVTASYREVTLSGVAERLNRTQLRWLTERFAAVGGTRVAAFPSLAQRIGAFHSITDFPPSRPCRPTDKLERIWNCRVGTELRKAVFADLALRAYAPGAVAVLRQHLLAVRGQIRGFTPLVAPGWSAALTAEIDAVVRELDGANPLGVLDSDRYLALLDSLVVAARAPEFGEEAHQSGAVVLTTLLRDRLAEFIAATGGLTVKSADAEWEAAWTAAVGLLGTCGVQVRPGKDVGRLARRTARILRQLDRCVRASEAYAALDVEGLTPAEAFEAGRSFERVYAEQRAARLAFLDDWPGRASKLVVKERP